MQESLAIYETRTEYYKQGRMKEKKDLGSLTSN